MSERIAVTKREFNRIAKSRRMMSELIGEVDEEMIRQELSELVGFRVSAGYTLVIVGAVGTKRILT